MAAGSHIHARSTRNLAFALRDRLPGSQFEVLSSEMRLCTNTANAGFHPDGGWFTWPVDQKNDSRLTANLASSAIFWL